jgi:hypothetical protein
MFWGGVAVFPLMLLYTFVSYRIFRGKVGEAAGYGHVELPPKPVSNPCLRRSQHRSPLVS